MHDFCTTRIDDRESFGQHLRHGAVYGLMCGDRKMHFITSLRINTRRPRTRDHKTRIFLDGERAVRARDDIPTIIEPRKNECVRTFVANLIVRDEVVERRHVVGAAAATREDRHIARIA